MPTCHRVYGHWFRLRLLQDELVFRKGGGGQDNPLHRFRSLQTIPLRNEVYQKLPKSHIREASQTARLQIFRSTHALVLLRTLRAGKP
jgi:hypothetical protein